MPFFDRESSRSLADSKGRAKRPSPNGGHGPKIVQRTRVTTIIFFIFGFEQLHDPFSLATGLHLSLLDSVQVSHNSKHPFQKMSPGISIFSRLRYSGII